MKETTITIRLPKELQDELSKLSQKEERPVSQIVRESINQYLAIKRFRDLRKRLLPFAEAQGLIVDEDIFKIIS